MLCEFDRRASMFQALDLRFPMPSNVIMHANENYEIKLLFHPLIFRDREETPDFFAIAETGRSGGLP
jgi:hypothetical protein